MLNSYAVRERERQFGERHLRNLSVHVVHKEPKNRFVSWSNGSICNIFFYNSFSPLTRDFNEFIQIVWHLFFSNNCTQNDANLSCDFGR